MEGCAVSVRAISINMLTTTVVLRDMTNPPLKLFGLLLTGSDPLTSGPLDAALPRHRQRKHALAFNELEIRTALPELTPIELSPAHRRTDDTPFIQGHRKRARWIDCVDRVAHECDVGQCHSRRQEYRPHRGDD